MIFPFWGNFIFKLPLPRSLFFSISPFLKTLHSFFLSLSFFALTYTLFQQMPHFRGMIASSGSFVSSCTSCIHFSTIYQSNYWSAIRGNFLPTDQLYFGLFGVIFGCLCNQQSTQSFSFFLGLIFPHWTVPQLKDCFHKLHFMVR